MTRFAKTVFILFISIALIIPPALYYIFSNVPTISAQEVIKKLQSDPGSITVLDVRDSIDFDKAHIQSAQNMPYDAFSQKDLSNGQITNLKSKRVYIICENGLASIDITRKLRKLDIKAFNIKGGMQAWIAAAGSICQKSDCDFIAASGKQIPIPFKTTPIVLQWVAVFNGIVIKPLYTLLSFIIIVILWKKTEPELRAIKYSMFFFFNGENSCAANYIFFNHDSYLFEYLHIVGMLLGFGFFLYGLFEGIDKYLLHYSDQKKSCSLTGLCRKCIKYDDVTCGLQRVLIFTGIAFSGIALMPVCAKLKMVSYNTIIVDIAYNYSHPVIYQLFEMQYLPVVASILMLAATFILWKNKNAVHTAKLVFAAAIGTMSFAIFRFVLFHCYDDSLFWMDFWEEITEFCFILSILFVLWTFRRSFFQRPGK
ncbi:MAG: rhodanese-like domain-containing protein [Proteobacteria bacterium]|nr:rhodanese-like domain-containing protein [Pseudomonadota bacterium]